MNGSYQKNLTYDRANQITAIHSLQDNKGSHQQFEYNAYGELTNVIEPNKKQSTQYHYDLNANRLSFNSTLGRLLIITAMNRGSKMIVKALGYSEEETDDISTPLYPIVFKHFDPIKLFYVLSIGHRDNFYNFFGKDDRNTFKEKISAQIKENAFYTLIYYKKDWQYQTYIDVGLVNKYYGMQYDEILLYQKYADNFNCPQEELDKAWAWYRENGYTFMEED